MDGVVQIVAPVQLHLDGAGGRAFNTTSGCVERTKGNDLLKVLADIQETCGHFR